MRTLRALALLTWLSSAGIAQELPSSVRLRLDSFPPSQVYIETPRGASYLGASGQELEIQPPGMTDASGRLVQYVSGFLVLKAPRHADLQVAVGAGDWNKGRLPGVYRLAADNWPVAAGDLLSGYPWLGAVLTGGLLGLGWLGKRALSWREQARRERQASAQMARQLETTGDPLLGRKLGDYQVLARLGQGGMGAVYRVSHPDGGEFAAKWSTSASTRPSNCNDSVANSRFCAGSITPRWCAPWIMERPRGWPSASWSWSRDSC